MGSRTDRRADTSIQSQSTQPFPFTSLHAGCLTDTASHPHCPHISTSARTGRRRLSALRRPAPGALSHSPLKPAGQRSGRSETPAGGDRPPPAACRACQTGRRRLADRRSAAAGQHSGGYDVPPASPLSSSQAAAARRVPEHTAVSARGSRGRPSPHSLTPRPGPAAGHRPAAAPAQIASSGSIELAGARAAAVSLVELL